MIVKLLAQLLFYAVMILLGVMSALMIYILLRFGKSRILGLVLSAFYFLLMTSLFAAAVANFHNIPFPKI